MALIKCPECGNEISNKAQSFPNCGYPISEMKNVEVPTEPTIQKRKKTHLPFIIVRVELLKGNFEIFQ